MINIKNLKKLTMVFLMLVLALFHRQAAFAGTVFGWPTPGSTGLYSGFGNGHYGLDIAADKQKWTDFYAAKIEAVIDECDYSTTNLTEKLREYFSTLDAAKETKTQFSYELPSGKLVLKKAKTEFKITDEDKFTAAVAERLPGMMKTKTVSKPDWAEIKKNMFQWSSGNIGYVDDDGMVTTLDGVELVETPEKFEVK